MWRIRKMSNNNTMQGEIDGNGDALMPGIYRIYI
jgi:hypothetical protein